MEQFGQALQSPLLKELADDRWQQYKEALTPEQSKQLACLEQSQQQLLFKGLGLSDFIFNTARQYPQLVLTLFHERDFKQAQASDYQARLEQLLVQCHDENDLHQKLRQFRAIEMLVLAVRDLCLGAALSDSLRDLSVLADILIGSALDWLTTFCQQQWGTPTNVYGETMPMLVYGMGKLGGKELNFSSDIDLIFAYPESGETIGGRRSLDNQQFFTRLGQKLIAALGQQTADGIVYRVDMRLRPFGESGPLVLSFAAMEDYYQEQGRDWERYAMLKARLIGEGRYHKQLSDSLRPFVYRRYIDFSVIESLRRMKMMIRQEVRRKQLSNNIKLGAGGIREVEFIVQVFQLIRGGREPVLQERNLLTVLPRLVASGALEENSAQALRQAYCFLRRSENIIQALADKQTQTLPDNELDQARLVEALANEYPVNNWAEYQALCQSHMEKVNEEFDLLIGEDAPNQQAASDYWLTLWHSDWQDEEAENWIIQEHPQWPAHNIWQLLKGFRQELAKRSLGQRGRQVLDKLMPIILGYMLDSPEVEHTLARVVRVINQIMTRTAYLELLYENEGACRQLIKLCQASSWISEYLSKFPILLDELLDPKQLYNPPGVDSYEQELRQAMLRILEDDLEAQMEALRQFKLVQQLRIAAADVSGVLEVTNVSDHLTALAQAIITEVVNLSWQQMLQRYGQPEHTCNSEDKGFGVIGYGKLGGIELGYGSDLDLVFIHQCDAQVMTNGQKAIAGSQFYLKMAQRIMHLCNTRTTSGILYEVDMRLRPSGNSGLLVVHINTFGQYQQEDAWTWEHQALVRARLVYGDQELMGKFASIRQQVLSNNRDKLKLAKEVVEMRTKMRDHLDKSTTELKDIKQCAGGLADIEFIAQYLVLAYGGQYPQLIEYSDNIRIFQQVAKAGILHQEKCEQLIEGYCQLRDMGHNLVLQSKPTLAPVEQIEGYTLAVADIWQELLLSQLV
jgi:glutamate-ammonia-ligase adenylyltransferase